MFTCKLNVDVSRGTMVYRAYNNDGETYLILFFPSPYIKNLLTIEHSV